MTIHQRIQAYMSTTTGEHNRHRSWEHCYGFFRRVAPNGLVGQRDYAALQLGFYLASWGMYRGASFLLQHAYTLHRGVVDCLAEQCFLPLWESEFGSGDGDERLVPLILEVIEGIRDVYGFFHPPTDTLVTKVILGTFGCLPACDRYFVAGFKRCGFKYSSLNKLFIDRIACFCHDKFLGVLQDEQAQIRASSGMNFPLMKLVDMYFHETGWDL